MVKVHGVIVESAYSSLVYEKITDNLHLPKNTIRAQNET